MKIEGAEIILNQSSVFILEATDSVEHCLIKIKKSELGVNHPITIKAGATFQYNTVKSQIPKPIWLDETSTDNFLGVGDNYYHEGEEID